MTLSDQNKLDYTQQAQQRVGVAVRAFTLSATLTIPSSGEVALPADVVDLMSLNLAGVDYPQVSAETYLLQLSGGSSIVAPGHIIFSRTLYVVPLPAADSDFVIVYEARPVDLDSGSDLSLDPAYKRIVEWRVLGDMMRDERQDELAAYYDDLVAQELGKQRSVYRPEQPQRLRHAAYDS